MIVKFLSVLAIVSQITAYKYNQNAVSYIKPEQGVTSNLNYYQPVPVKDKIITPVVKSSSYPSSTVQSHYVRPAINSPPVTRNLVARGKYPVTLQNSGPAPDKKIAVVTSHVRAPVQENPTVRLQTKIPTPKTIAHTCTCFKTILKPRVQQHIITVPTIQRYIETLHRPVIENIHYEGYPIKCYETNSEKIVQEKEKNYQSQSVDLSAIPGLQLSSAKLSNENSEIQTFDIPTAQSLLPRIQTEGTQLVEIPRVRFAESETENMEVPRVQLIQNKNPQTIEIPQSIELPRVQFIESQKSEAFQIPRAQFSENKKPLIMEIPNAQFVENNRAETIELPRLEFLQAQKLQTVEIPRIQVKESPKVQTLEIPHQRETITLDAAAPFTYQLNR